MAKRKKKPIGPSKAKSSTYAVDNMPRVKIKKNKYEKKKM